MKTYDVVSLALSVGSFESSAVDRNALSKCLEEFRVEVASNSFSDLTVLLAGHPCLERSVSTNRKEGR